MTIPNELVLEILQYLDKAQLKRVRLVSKLWSGCASEYLFAKLFISSHQLDLQIFTTVARDPFLSRCVKEVEYDAIHFSPNITISDYLDILWLQTREIASTKGVFKNSDPQICLFVAIRRASSKSGWLEARKNEDQALVRDFTFIQEGYRKWMDEAILETRCSELTTFAETLISGLKQLSQLKAVRLRDSWPSDGKLNGEGSPLARSWSPFHAYPRDWTIEHSMHGTQSRATGDFWTLAFTLSKAGRTGIRKLFFETIRTPSLFAVRSGEVQNFGDPGVTAYCALEDMKVSFAGFPVALSFSLPDLQRMLDSMTALKRLELKFHEPHDFHEDLFFSYEMVFPKDGHWPQLSTFTLRGFAIGTKDLITLLTTKMPSLRHLTFGSIGLLDGQWEGVIEYLRVSNRLSTFDTLAESVLNHHEDQDFLIDRTEADNSRDFHDDCLKFRRSIEEYVVNWRHKPILRHPSLRLDQPAQSSLNYLYDVYRLCGMDATGGTMDGLAKHMEEEVARFTGKESTERE